MVTADHGPAVSGAHNTIVCARAGKDLISSLTSGLLTIVSILQTVKLAIHSPAKFVKIRADALLASLGSTKVFLKINKDRRKIIDRTVHPIRYSH